MERTVSATDARIHLGELMRQVVEDRERIIIERGGRPHVVVISVEEYERLVEACEQQRDWRDLVRRSRERVQMDLAGRDLAPPEEVIREMREERDEQLLGDALR